MTDWSETPTPPPSPPPPGWYPDPSGTGGQRYWDGLAWTEHLAAAAVPPPPPAYSPSYAPANTMTYVGPPVRSIGFVEAVRRALKGWSDYSTRATVAEYWWFVLFEIAVLVPLYVVGLVALLATSSTSVDSTSGTTSTEFTSGNATGIAVVLILTLLAVLVLFLPRLALTVRRLHDGNRSGWWIFISFVPFGSIVLLVFMIMAGTPGPNQYGPPVS